MHIPLELFDQVLIDAAIAWGPSVPFVINKLIFPRKGSLSQSTAALKTTTPIVEFARMMFTPVNIEQVLSQRGIHMTRSFNIVQLEERSNTTFMVFCELNESFESKKFTTVTCNTNHVVLIRNGMIHCTYLRKHDCPVKLSVHKHLFITTDEFNTDNTRNSYINRIKSIYIIS